MPLSIIVAAAENNVIGSRNQLPWHLPDDLKRFKALSLGKPVVMGRKTYESIGRPLPGRTNIVVSRQPELHIDGCIVVPTLDAAIAASPSTQETVVIGGAGIFRHALPYTTTVHLTRVHASVDGDVHFPPLDPSQWREIAVEHHAADARHAYAFTFIDLQRIAP
jgi:dihydrofolate reductase